MEIEEAKRLLEDGTKLRPVCWRKECFIYYDKFFMGCYDELDHIVNLKSLSGEEFERLNETNEVQKR